MQESYRALVVDDDEMLRELVKRALVAEGFLVDTAPDGVAAESLLAGRRYDVLITDLRMPNKHGYALLSGLFDQPDRPMLIVMTGVEEPRLIADLIMRGVDDVAKKPLSFSVFAASIKARLVRRRNEESAPKPGASQEAQIANKIRETTNQLKSQLAEITQTFGDTISDLEKQRDELESGYIGSVRMLTNLLSQLERTEGSHVTRVETIASAIALDLRLDGAELRNLKIASLLHDIGLFGMPDRVRAVPPWSLSGVDMTAYHKYPVIGATLLSEVVGTEEVVSIIIGHAENFDGSGFPARKKGEEIPLAARILRVADGCDTFLMHSKSDSPQEHLSQHLQLQRGKAYDPKLTGPALLHTVSLCIDKTVGAVQVVETSDLHPGHVLAEDVHDTDGHFLARSGATVSSSMVLHLKRLMRGQHVKVYAETALK